MDLLTYIVICMYFTSLFFFFIFKEKIPSGEVMIQAYVGLFQTVLNPFLGAISLAILYLLTIIYEKKIVRD